MNCGLPRFAELIQKAVYNVYAEGKYLTKDVGGNAKATEFTKRVVDEIKSLD
jgi:isocitrate dehydrogenase (NAD+)